MRGETILRWMSEEERTLGYLARQSGIDPERLITLITGDDPTVDEAAALAAATDIPAEQLTGSASYVQPAALVDPYQCYTVAEVARILRISADTVRKEIREGLLAHVVLGERALRIPRRALARRLDYPDDGRDHDVPAGMSRQTPTHGPTDPQASLF